MRCRAYTNASRDFGSKKYESKSGNAKANIALRIEPA